MNDYARNYWFNTFRYRHYRNGWLNYNKYFYA